MAAADGQPTIGEVLARATARLAGAGVASPRLDAGVLLAEAHGCDRLALLRRSAEPIAGAPQRRFTAFLARRLAGEPVSRIRRRREFWSLELGVGPGVLDPRPETETVVEAVLDRLGDRGRPLRLLDLGTGSGCLLLALLSELPGARGLGVDRAPAAAAMCRENAVQLGLAERVSVLVGDWATPLATDFDLVVCNPPYVRTAELAGLGPEVRLFDPRAALDGGADGLAAYRRIVPGLARLLADGGLAALECGSGQAGEVARLLRQAGLEVLDVRADLAGHARCVVARRG